MSRCVNCEYAMHEQFRGHPGRWLCFHPHRCEISNGGEFTYPGNDNPVILICETSVADYNRPISHRKALEAHATPVWCYFDVVERAQAEQPGFDPDVQRQILWPEKVEGHHGR